MCDLKLTPNCGSNSNYESSGESCLILIPCEKDWPGHLILTSGQPYAIYKIDSQNMTSDLKMDG
jgi:hypothetical protein